MAKFDPNETVSSEFGIFGLPFQEKESRLILLPVPWEVTTSYGMGTALGPQIIREASEQIDLFDLETGKSYEKGIHMLPFSQEIYKTSSIFKAKAQKVMIERAQLSTQNSELDKLQDQVNQASVELNNWVYQQSNRILKEGKLLGLVGGDHSVPFGAVKAISEATKGQFGILHIDAHADLRKNYQGFQFSHASIMRNIMDSPIRPQKLVQVGIRDFCEDEHLYIKKHHSDIKTFFDLHLKNAEAEGRTWANIAQEIIGELPEKIYVSFDIDGLDPALCPNTGTPVVGGLAIHQAWYLFSEIHRQKKKIIGFDLNEVSPGQSEKSEWDGNVGARVLYKLCCWTLFMN